MNIAVIGTGLIGGSIARELRRAGQRVIGVDKNTSHLARAEELGIIDEGMTLENALDNAKVIAVCIPVDHLESKIPLLLDKIDEEHIVFDVGSTKELICNAVADHPMRHRFVAAHPLAGTEHSGPEAALLGLFDGKKNIICEHALSDQDALDQVIDIFESMGMKSYFLNAAEHDKHMAFVSHLSHVSSFALSQTVLDIEKDEKQIFNLASTGFASTARLAKCNPHTWAAIFSKNKDHLSQALDAYIKHVQAFKVLVDEIDVDGMYEAISEANEIKRVLNGIKLNKS